MGWIGEYRGLTAEEGLTESVIEEGVLHIELLNRQVTGGSNGKHHAYAESLIVVTRATL
jgi:hypothetical protein